MEKIDERFSQHCASELAEKTPEVAGILVLTCPVLGLTKICVMAFTKRDFHPFAAAFVAVNPQLSINQTFRRLAKCRILRHLSKILSNQIARSFRTVLSNCTEVVYCEADLAPAFIDPALAFLVLQPSQARTMVKLSKRPS